MSVTICEVFGHKYVQVENDSHHFVCTDCGDDYRDDEEDVEADAKLAGDRATWRVETGQ